MPAAETGALKNGDSTGSQGFQADGPDRCVKKVFSSYLSTGKTFYKNFMLILFVENLYAAMVDKKKFIILCLYKIYFR